jgi:hypothetical protein
LHPLIFSPFSAKGRGRNADLNWKRLTWFWIGILPGKAPLCYFTAIMHELEPWEGWEKIYNPATDDRSPFYGLEYAGYENAIYNHLIHPLWDYIGSDTLYVKVLYTHYELGFTIIELLGEWNDTLHNDVMHLKRNLIDLQLQEGISRFILIGENVLNFHGLEDDYYQEWFDEVEDGWIVALGFRDFIYEQWARYGLDYFLIWGGKLELENWRTLSPKAILDQVESEVRHRLN